MYVNSHMMESCLHNERGWGGVIPENCERGITPQTHSIKFWAKIKTLTFTLNAFVSSVARSIVWCGERYLLSVHWTRSWIFMTRCNSKHQARSQLPPSLAISIEAVCPVVTFFCSDKIQMIMMYSDGYLYTPCRPYFSVK